MGARFQTIQRGFKHGRTVERPIGLVDLIFDVKDKIDDDDPNRTTFDDILLFTEIVGLIAETGEVAIEQLNNFNKQKFEPVLDGITQSWLAATQAEATADAFAKFPVAPIRSAAKAIEEVADFYGDQALQFERAMHDVQSKMDAIDARFATLKSTLNVISVIGDIASVIGYVKQISEAVAARDTVLTGETQIRLLEDLGGTLAADGETFDIDVPEDMIVAFNAAMDAFDARFATRTDAFAEVDTRIQSMIDRVTALAPNGIEQFRIDFEAKLDGIVDLFDNLGFLEDLSVFGAISDAIGSVTDVLDVVFQAIKPVLDVFGPVLSIINGVIESIEDAVGLSTLRDTIRSAIEDQVNNLTQPIRDKIDELIDSLAFPEFDQLLSFLNDFIGLRDVLREIELNPVAQAASGPTGELLDNNAVITGGDGDDTNSSAARSEIR